MRNNSALGCASESQSSGPLLFFAYMSPITRIIDSCGVQQHHYADDTTLYIDVNDPKSLPPSALARCCDHVIPGGVRRGGAGGGTGPPSLDRGQWLHPWVELGCTQAPQSFDSMGPLYTVVLPFFRHSKTLGGPNNNKKTVCEVLGFPKLNVVKPCSTRVSI